MSRRNLLILLVASFVLLAVGTTIAYFTTQSISQSLVVGTGSLSVEMNSISQTELSNLVPGDTEIISWVVTNTGTTPVAIKGRVENIWSDPTLTGGLKVTKIEAQVGEEWLTLAENSAGIVDEFFYSPNQIDADLFGLAPNEQLPMRLTLELDQQTSDEFQTQTSELSVHLAAKQLGAETPWPESY